MLQQDCLLLHVLVGGVGLLSTSLWPGCQHHVMSLTVMHFCACLPASRRYFYQDGNIGYEVKLTGILSTHPMAKGQTQPRCVPCPAHAIRLLLTLG